MEIYDTKTQKDATWGIDRIDAREGLDKKYTYEFDGTDVDLFILDTGIDPKHKEFLDTDGNSRYTQCIDFTSEGCNRRHFHGTHVGMSLLLYCIESQVSFGLPIVATFFSIC